MMNDKVFDYRASHKKCKYCRWLTYVSPPAYLPTSGYYECLAKKKVIGSYLPDFTNMPRLFCKCYEVENEEINCSARR